MKIKWNRWTIIVLIWFVLGIYGLYHFIAQNTINAGLVLAIVSFGVGGSIALYEVRLKGVENMIDGVVKVLENKIDGVVKGLENKIDGLGYKIDGINQRISDHLSKHE